MPFLPSLKKWPLGKGLRVTVLQRRQRRRWRLCSLSALPGRPGTCIRRGYSVIEVDERRFWRRSCCILDNFLESGLWARVSTAKCSKGAKGAFGAFLSFLSGMDVQGRAFVAVCSNGVVANDAVGVVSSPYTMLSQEVASSHGPLRWNGRKRQRRFRRLCKKPLFLSNRRRR